ncbi:MAG TPA: hypothetical protein VFS20_24235 [Longimicrobium sp.]|nr:hypothetical protein [Longimicrobium sp.]
MRPTIPLSHWRLAIDLDATRAVREAEERHTRDCPCRICRNWARVYADSVPAELQTQLRRVGADPADPTELWASERPNGAYYHVVFHCVGKILSGPPAMVIGYYGAGRDYRKVRADMPAWMTVSYIHDTVPDWVMDQMEPLIRVDLVLDVPWVLKTPLHPPEREAPKPWRGVRPANQRTWRRRFRRFNEYMQGGGDTG